MTTAPPPAPPSADPPAAAYDPPPGFPVRPPLRRSRGDKVIGGVAGGLADYSGIDPLLWRIGFVALAVAGPGVPVYLLLWVLTPAEPSLDPARTDRPRRAAGPRSPVPGLTMAALLIVVGLLAAVTALTGWDVGPVGFLGSALLVVGLGLVAAAFTGGRRAKGGLITLGVVLSLALIAAAAEPWRHVEGGVGDREHVPQTAADVRSVYELGAGNLLLDLTEVRLAGLDGPVSTRVDVGVGNIEVLVPRSADVRVDVEDRMGEVELFDTGSHAGTWRGTGSSWSGDDEPEFVLTIDAGLGNVEVSRA